mmetsp:Transcript_21518/g.28311  ORF Transcript_21518/g.28311 Transcript_21518/m.28311 type:complete len:462 (+) Transcript_21518:270-1655(+)
MAQHAEDWPEESIRLSNKFGKTWGGPYPVNKVNTCLFMVDEASIRHVLSENSNNYEKGDGSRSFFRELLGNGIFLSDGDQWFVHRKIMSKMFSRNLLRRTSEVIQMKLEQIASLLLNAMETEEQYVGSAEPRISLDLQDIFFRMTFDVTSFVALGCEIDSIGTYGAEGGQHPFAEAFGQMQEAILQRFGDPFYKLKRVLQIGSRERRITVLSRTLADHAASIINDRRRTIEDGSELGPDILTRYLEYSKRNNVPMSNEELKDVVTNVLIAGRDATACLLTWSFYELSKRPDVIDKIISEVENVCTNGEDSDYSYDNVSKLQYTHAFVLEVLRLHPSVAIDHRRAINNDRLPDGTFVPAGAMINWMPIQIGRSKHIWGEDALEFKPERFIDLKEPSPFKYPAFGAGPRLCLGKPLALMTVKTTLAYLLPKFQLIDRLGHSGEAKWKMVISMKGGFLVDVCSR